MLTVFITSNQIPLHVHAVFCHNNYYIIVFPLHIIMYVHVHCIQLARGMMRMRIPSSYMIAASGLYTSGLVQIGHEGVARVVYLN